MKWLKMSSLSGILAPFVAFALILLSIAYSPDFSWTENALSDLGVQCGVTAVLFNTGLVASGILAVFFAVGLFIFLQGSLLGRVGALIFVADSVALAVIGVFPENVEPMHYYASVSFFALLPIFMIFLGTAFLQAAELKLGLFTFLTAVFAAVVWIVPFGKGVAIPEGISALSVATWSVVLGFEILRQCSR